MDVPLQFVVGKGGVGKSTLTAALALRSASRGQRTLVVEFGGRGGVSRLFGQEDEKPGQPAIVAPRLTLVALEGDEALAEYLRMVVPIKRLLSLVFASRMYSVFVAGAPGLKELMTVGKVWYESDRRMATGEPVWDRIFVDAGASGHSLQYLQMPSAATVTFKSGVVHREAARIQSLLADPAKARVHVITTPEEMPVTEAVAIVSRLRDSLHLPLGRLFVNRCRERSPEGARDALAELQRRIDANDGTRSEEPPHDGGDIDEQTLRMLMRDAIDSAIEWEQVQETAIDRVETETGLRAARLPWIAAEEFGRAEAEKLATMLDSIDPDGTAPARGASK
jgi:anion-transporting  ArsA/GET3 family ATPase